MGCASSAPAALTGDRRFNALAQRTNFRPAQVRVLYKIYENVSNSLGNANMISLGEFQLALFGKRKAGDGDGASDDLFSARIFACFDTTNDGTLSFEEFVCGLSVFHPQASKMEKTRFAFKVYDLQGTGRIERQDVRRMLDAVMRQSKDMTLSDEALDMAVDQTFEDCDLKKDGAISLDEFEKLVDKNEKIIANMTLPMLSRLTKEFPAFLFTDDGE